VPANGCASAGPQHSRQHRMASHVASQARLQVQGKGSGGNKQKGGCQVTAAPIYMMLMRYRPGAHIVCAAEIMILTLF